MASGAVTKRLQSELMGLMMEPAPGVTAFPDGDSLTTWTATLTPDGDSAYAGCAFRLRLAFPGNYPVAPPGVRFVTRVWHPNVDYPSGAICLDLLKDAWSPSLTVRTLLISLLSLLDEPNNASPLNGEAARGWDDRAAFVATAKAKYEEEVAAGGGGVVGVTAPLVHSPPVLPFPSRLSFGKGGGGGKGAVLVGVAVVLPAPSPPPGSVGSGAEAPLPWMRAAVVAPPLLRPPLTPPPARLPAFGWPSRH